MGIRFSEIERLTEKRLIIENGKPYWEEHVLSGSINFKSITEEVVKDIKDNVLSKIQGNISDEELAYMVIPHLTDVEDDIDLDRFLKMIKTENEVMIVLYEGILDSFSGLIDFSEKALKVKDKAEKIEGKLPHVDMKELQRQELNELYKQFAIVTDNKERDKLIKRVIELKNELGE